jgi:hypothetical protein
MAPIGQLETETGRILHMEYKLDVSTTHGIHNDMLHPMNEGRLDDIE